MFIDEEKEGMSQWGGKAVQSYNMVIVSASLGLWQAFGDVKVYKVDKGAELRSGFRSQHIVMKPWIMMRQSN